jgi:outer membrane protein
MKNVSLVLNIVLAIAVAVLYYLHFKSPSNNASKNSAIRANMKIAYVNTDSLLEHYDFYIKSKKEMQEQEEKNSTSLNNQAQALQREYEDAQARVGSMTAAQAESVQASLQRKQQSLMQQKEKLSEEFGASMQKMTDDLTNKMHSYLKEYNKSKHYDYILGYQKGSGILYAESELEITDEVRKGMNEAYQKGK